jgi:hypothetical protein
MFGVLKRWIVGQPIDLGLPMHCACCYNGHAPLPSPPYPGIDIPAMTGRIPWAACDTPFDTTPSSSDACC